MRACRSWNCGFRKDDARASVLTIARHTGYASAGRSCPSIVVVTDHLEAMDPPEIARGSLEAETKTSGIELIAEADAVSLEAAIWKLLWAVQELRQQRASNSRDGLNSSDRNKNKSNLCASRWRWPV